MYLIQYECLTSQIGQQVNRKMYLWGQCVTVAYVCEGHRGLIRENAECASS